MQTYHPASLPIEETHPDYWMVGYERCKARDCGTVGGDMPLGQEGNRASRFIACPFPIIPRASIKDLIA